MRFCPFYEGMTYMRVHVVAFAGGGTVGRAASIACRPGRRFVARPRNFSVVLHLLLPQRGYVPATLTNTYQLQLRKRLCDSPVSALHHPGFR